MFDRSQLLLSILVIVASLLFFLGLLYSMDLENTRKNECIQVLVKEGVPVDQAGEACR